MARKYPKQYTDTRERVESHRDRFVESADAERMLKMANAYDPDNLVVDTPNEQDTKSVTTLKTT